ncbi:MAG: rod-binding protein [Burkholderiaceae bacterium]|jgi:flagellar protein FlgJ
MNTKSASVLGSAQKSLGLDARDLSNLKNLAKADASSPEFQKAIDQTARQFESVFLDMVLKSMRQALPQGGLFESEAGKTFQSMQDQHMVQGLSARGVGLASVIAKQLQGKHS